MATLFTIFKNDPKRELVLRLEDILDDEDDIVISRGIDLALGEVDLDAPGLFFRFDQRTLRDEENFVLLSPIHSPIVTDSKVYEATYDNGLLYAPYSDDRNTIMVYLRAADGFKCYAQFTWLKRIANLDGTTDFLIRFKRGVNLNAKYGKTFAYYEL